MPIIPDGANQGGMSYVPYGPRLSFPPPFKCTGGKFIAFVISADAGQLKATVDKTLNNAAREVKYCPLGSFVVLMVGHYERQESTAPAFYQTGYASETAMCFWLPVKSTHDSRVRLMAPFVVVDNPMSMVCGREDFGYAKSMAKFYPEEGLGETVTVNAYGGNPGRDSKAGWTPLLKIVSSKAAVGDAQQAATQLAEKVYPEGLPFGLDWLEVLGQLLKREVLQVFLKQFRDARTPTQVAYEQIIEAPLRFPSVSVLPHSFWTYEIFEVGTYPIVQELGIKKPQDTLLAFQITTDMELGGENTVEMDKLDYAAAVAGGTVPAPPPAPTGATNSP